MAPGSSGLRAHSQTWTWSLFTARDQQTDVLDLKEALEESSLPFAVAVLVWDELPESFRKHIVPEYVVVQEGSDEQSAAASEVGNKRRWTKFPFAKWSSLQ